MTSNALHKDIRSPSVPDLRFYTQRAKYGGPLPTSTGLPYSAAFPGLTFHPPTGSFLPSPPHLPPQAPTQHLTKGQLYRLAQNYAPSLVGKHVNRNNQRTGERDPWNHCGPKRRWRKAIASGKAGLRDPHTWFAQDSGSDDAEQDELIAQWYRETCAIFAQRKDAGAAVDADAVWGQKYGDDGEGLRIVEDGRREKARRGRRRSMGDWRLVTREDVEARWTDGDIRGKRRDDRDEDGEQDDEEWEVVAFNSAPE